MSFEELGVDSVPIANMEGCSRRSGRHSWGAPKALAKDQIIDNQKVGLVCYYETLFMHNFRGCRGFDGLTFERSMMSL